MESIEAWCGRKPSTGHLKKISLSTSRSRYGVQDRAITLCITRFPWRKRSFLCITPLYYHEDIIFLAIMSTKMITLICFWNKKIITGKKGISYEGPPPVTNCYRFWATFHELMEKLYQETDNEKQYICLMVFCGYLVPKQYVALLITVNRRWR